MLQSHPGDVGKEKWFNFWTFRLSSLLSVELCTFQLNKETVYICMENR